MSADILLVIVGIAALMIGYPAALTLGGVAVVFAVVGVMTGTFDPFLLSAVPSRLFGILTSQILLAVPLFVFMGLVLEKSGVAEAMFSNLARYLRNRRGGLGVAVTIVGAMLAASTGIVGASVVTLGLIALPALLDNGVRADRAAGTVAAAGTLGQIVPPSIVLIVLGDQMSNAFQKMQSDSGQFSVDTVSVSDLFAGAILPAMLLVGLYVCWQFLTADKVRDNKPAVQHHHAGNNFGDLLVFMAPVILILLVLGSILGGVATPTESAALGAVGALFLAARHQAVSRAQKGVSDAGLGLLLFLFILRWLFNVENAAVWWLGIAASAAFSTMLLSSIVALNKVGVLRPVLAESVHLISMIFLIVIGTSIFALVFRGFGGDDTVNALLSDLPGGTWSALLIVMLAIFVLGFFLEFLEITYLVVPLVAPVLLSLPMGDGSVMSPIWLGVLIALNLQTSFLTPPFGVSLFYLRSVAAQEITTNSIYRGCAPYIFLQLLVLAVVLVFPALTTWLPQVLFAP